MDREKLIGELDRYRAWDALEETMRARIRQFVAQNADCFRRSLRIGHITTSAWIVDAARERTLLTHHRRLGRWLQMGGHIEADATLLESAMREAREESGLTGIRALGEGMFDLDVHGIPARGQEPAHDHYDIRFLLEADPEEPLRISEESHEIAWVEIARAGEWNGDASMLRMAAKTRAGSGF